MNGCSNLACKLITILLLSATCCSIEKIENTEEATSGSKLCYHQGNHLADQSCHNISIQAACNITQVKYLLPCKTTATLLHLWVPEQAKSTLNLVWLLPDGGGATGEEATLLFTDPHANSNVCYHLSLNESALLTNHTKLLYSLCLVEVEMDHVYTASLEVSTDESPLQYSISIPPQLASSTPAAAASSAGWNCLIAVAHRACDSTVLVTFTPAPSHVNVTLYAVNLRHMRLPHLYNSTHYLDYNVTYTMTMFNTASAPRGNYTISVWAAESSCGRTCSTESKPFLLHSEMMESSGSSPEMSTASIQLSTYSSRSQETTECNSTETTASPLKDVDIHRNAKIIGGVVGGMAGAALVILLIFCIHRRYYRSWPGSLGMQPFHNQDSDGDIAMEYRSHSVPSILLLYSYDCELHERVIIELASYIQHVFGCRVLLDIWEQADIQNRGAYIWLQEKLDTCQFVLVVCSSGARYKCARSRQFYLRQDRPIPEMFTSAVDMVAEKFRLAKMSGENLDAFTVAYFDYAGPSDIPTKLDTAASVCLMRDIHLVYCRWFNIKPHVFEEMRTSGKKRKNNNYKACQGMTGDSYFLTETGRQLHVALERARGYFQNNPDWLAQVVEPVACPSRPLQSPTMNNNRNSDQAPENPDNHDSEVIEKYSAREIPPERDGKNGEERNSRREKRHDYLSPVPGSPSSAPTQLYSKQNGGVLTSGEGQTRSPSLRSGHVNSPLISNHSWSPSTTDENGAWSEGEEELVCYDSDAQLQRDIAHIHNFDQHPSWSSLRPISPTFSWSSPRPISPKFSWSSPRPTSPTFRLHIHTDTEEHLGFDNPMFVDSRSAYQPPAVHMLQPHFHIPSLSGDNHLPDSIQNHSCHSDTCILPPVPTDYSLPSTGLSQSSANSQV